MKYALLRDIYTHHIHFARSPPAAGTALLAGSLGRRPNHIGNGESIGTQGVMFTGIFNGQFATDYELRSQWFSGEFTWY
jgi:hypothetical protein